MKRKNLLTGIFVFSATLCLMQGGWIYTKAMLVQILLDLTWAQSLESGQSLKPWPWADTHPIARLTIPSQQQDLVVLDGYSGEAMAFGPARISPPAGSTANATVIGGHRDTHLAFLQHSKVGEELLVEFVDGNQSSFLIEEFMIINSEKESLLIDWQQQALVLITCYPFETLDASGPLRYVALALPSRNQDPI